MHFLHFFCMCIMNICFIVMSAVCTLRMHIYWKYLLHHNYYFLNSHPADWLPSWRRVIPEILLGTCQVMKLHTFYGTQGFILIIIVLPFTLRSPKKGFLSRLISKEILVDIPQCSGQNQGVCSRVHSFIHSVVHGEFKF